MAILTNVGGGVGNVRYNSSTDYVQIKYNGSWVDWKIAGLQLDASTLPGVKNIVNAHQETSLLTVGDEYSVTLTDTTEMVWRIAAINHDSDYAHQVIFEPKWCLPSTRAMNATDTNVGGWNSSALRLWLNSDFYSNMLPEEVQDVISARDIITSQGNQSTSLQTASDKIWLPREYEIFGTTTVSVSTEHSSGGAEQFDIYADSNNRIKTQGQDGSAVRWWDCSPYASGVAYFCGCSAAGNASYYEASATYGVAPCFHIIADE